MTFCKDDAFKDGTVECKISIPPPTLFLLPLLPSCWLICDIRDPENIYASYVFI